MRLLAPAKINWTLEVLRRRDDGYHEVRTIMQTIDLCDEVLLQPAETLALTVQGRRSPSEDDLALRAASVLAETAGRPASAAISLVKRIPVAAGLGGGSSDAAAVLRGLDRLWALGFGQDRLRQVAARSGSDVAFFLYGGTALAAGRGEVVTPLADAPEVWLVLLAPALGLPEKTRRMYEALAPADFSDGARSDALVRRLRRSGRPQDADLYNAFERLAYAAFPGLAAYRDALLDAGARRVHLAGSGPGLFALAADKAEASRLQGRLRLPPPGPDGPPEAHVFVVRTLPAAAATQIQE